MESTSHRASANISGPAIGIAAPVMSYATARGSRHSMEATPGPFVADQHMQTDAGVAAGTSDEPQEPTLLQKAAGAASAVAQGAADLAAGAYAAAVGTSATTSTPEGEEEGQAAAADRSSIGTTAIPDLKGGNAAGPLDAAGLQRRTATGDRTGAETTTNPTTAPAAVPPALAGTPAPTGQGYVPVAGAVAPTATPAPRPSGECVWKGGIASDACIAQLAVHALHGDHLLLLSAGKSCLAEGLRMSPASSCAAACR